MPTPLEDHGGIDPGADFPKILADTYNKVILIVHPQQSSFEISKFYNSLVLSHVQAILLRIPQSIHDTIQVPHLHPLFEFLPRETNPVDVCMEILHATKQTSVFVYEVLPGMSVPQELWCALRCTPQGMSTKFLVGDIYHQLLSLTPAGIVAADGEQVAFPMPLKSILSEIAIDTSGSYTELCALATKFGTDKSPYNITTHRHPYTPIYDMFLHGFQSKNVKLGEIGVLNGASTQMWQAYFPTAELFGFDISQNCLNNMQMVSNAKGVLVDAGNPQGLKAALQEACADGKKFDILLEDASHRLDHQLIFLRDALDFVAPGGVLIIEDIFRAIPAARFEEVLRTHGDKISKALLVRPEHAYRFSPGWENDRILFVWVR